MTDNKTYLQTLIHSLEKKAVVLEQLINITKVQESMMKDDNFDSDKFNRTLEKKGRLISQITQLDIGFESVYNRIKDLLQGDKDSYKAEIRKLQELIGILTDKSVKLQAMEQQNKSKVEFYISNRKKKIKDQKMSLRVAKIYSGNMPDRYQEKSCFLDRKK